MRIDYQATIRVDTFKAAGRLLSRLAHDLRLRLEDFELSFDAGKVSLAFAPASLRVEGAVVDGELSPVALSDRHKTEIQSNIKDEVLHTGRHPRGTFEGRYREGEQGVRVEGTLTLLGRSHTIEFELRAIQKGFEGAIQITPSRWGIVPYTAMLGALRLQDKVEVLVTLERISSNA